jgi:hypothetical protein
MVYIIVGVMCIQVGVTLGVLLVLRLIIDKVLRDAPKFCSGCQRRVDYGIAPEDRTDVPPFIFP